MKKALTALMFISLLLLLIPAMAEAPTPALGQPLADFSVETIDGDTFTLSEALKDRDMVLINLWASWCGPCEMEFPYLEEAYEQYSDRVAVVALSTEPDDSPKVLREYAESHGLSFPVGSDSETRLADTFVTEGIPTSVVVDRFGNVALVEVGAQTNTGSFTALFDYFLSDDYAQTTVLDGIPGPKPVGGVSEAELSTINAGDGQLAFRNADDDETWPMLPAEDAGRAALVSSNAGVDESVAAVYTALSASEGDALAFEFRTSSELACDGLFIQIDGEVVKTFTGEHDWTQWAIPLEAGEHEIALGYRKDAYSEGGEDCAWIANVRVASGDEARALLEALPVYPVSEAFGASPASGDARRILFEDPDGLFQAATLTNEGWILDGDTAAIDIALSAEEDPETACVTLDRLYAMTELLKPDGSGYELSVPFAEDGFHIASIIPGTLPEQVERSQTMLLFRDEAGVDAFRDYLSAYGIDFTWRYADAEANEEAASAYTVTVVDQNGDPVPGAIVNFCTDDSCTPRKSDESGVITFEGEPAVYHLQILKVPEGYSFDETCEAYTEPEYSAMTLQVVKD